jgi:gamma-glutamyltranspeptidase/glutathione hydrolase
MVVGGIFLGGVCAGAAQAQAPSSPAAAGAKPEPREYAAKPATKRLEWPKDAVRGSKAMVVSDEELASKAGAEILKRGGNAVDAAVAVGFALAVVEPEAGNIGGGGFMLVRMNDGRTKFIDYRETAPAAATRDMYSKMDHLPGVDPSLVGYRAVAVPGTVAGMALALKTYGTMKLADVMAPAIALAENGFPISPRLTQLFQEDAKTLQMFSASRRIFLKGGLYFEPGEWLKQPELAATLRRIAQAGASDFYRGKLAHELADEMKREGGLVTFADLEHYEPKMRDVLTANYRYGGHDWQLLTSPPPSSGGVAMIEMLNILEPLELKGWDDTPSVHFTVEAMRRAFADRAAFLADPDFAKIPVRGMMSRCYADLRRKMIDPVDASSSDKVGPGDPAAFENAAADAPCPAAAGATASAGGGAAVAQFLPGSAEYDVAAAAAMAEVGHMNTTHFSVVDAAGNAVANTYTLNDSFGSSVTSEGGFLLNDEMDDFTAHPGEPNMFGLVQSEANTIGPGKRPLSSMTPTIVLRDGQLSFVTGSPGGPTIISVVTLTVIDWMRLGMTAQGAINAPRFHQQWMPDTVVLEPLIPDAVVKQLEAGGYTINGQRNFIGQVEAIGIDPDTKERLGAGDPRRDGKAVGF